MNVWEQDEAGWDEEEETKPPAPCSGTGRKDGGQVKDEFSSFTRAMKLGSVVAR
jgi:hypothetical protein